MVRKTLLLRNLMLKADGVYQDRLWKTWVTLKGEGCFLAGVCGRRVLHPARLQELRQHGGWCRRSSRPGPLIAFAQFDL
jgi:hypothetical protein